MLCLFMHVLVVVVAATATTTGGSTSSHPPPPARPIKLTLHHRSHLDNSSYESRDSVAANRKNSSYIYGQEEGFPVPLGAPNVDGEFLVTLGIGSPMVPYNFHLDTANLVSWLQCQPCVDCYEQNAPIYDPTQSVGFQLVLYNDPIWCPDLGSLREGTGEHGECLYSIGYADGAYTRGYLIRDTLTLIPDESNGPGEPFPGVTIGCSVDSHQALGGEIGDLSGNLALSRGPLSLVSILGVKRFSYCLVNPDQDNLRGKSYLILNADNPADFEISYQVQLLQRGPPQEEKFWYVNLIGIAVNDELIVIPPDAFVLDPNNPADTGVILDSGSDLTYFPPAVYEPLREAFLLATQVPEIELPEDSKYNLCFYNEGRGTIYPYPTLTFYFGEENAVNLFSRAFIDEFDSDIDCFSIVARQGLDSVLGANYQYGDVYFFDVDQNVLKVSRGDCID